MFLKGLAELGINKNLIGNKYLVSRLARFEDEVAESDEDSEGWLCRIQEDYNEEDSTR